MGGSEPTDAIRAVNALLTRLDQLRASPNVMVRLQLALPGGCQPGKGAALLLVHTTRPRLQQPAMLPAALPSLVLSSPQVLTTSNITEAIDLAFVDRADIKAYIGNPNQTAR